MISRDMELNELLPSELGDVDKDMDTCILPFDESFFNQLLEIEDKDTEIIEFEDTTLPSSRLIEGFDILADLYENLPAEVIEIFGDLFADLFAPMPLESSGDPEIIKIINNLPSEETFFKALIDYHHDDMNKNNKDHQQQYTKEDKISPSY
ncbi:hypothetical protein JCGZ_24001 [Jatropha curcas]|uniref:Uncharacterized protein n=2 Tax=Jatropha curcas TaxID=180498 RepID=A0A067JQA5_JATCU|nr:hypothetical protein JCGZ_24001 [Jatropha curcas]